MKICIGNSPYIDRETGLPLEGKIRVCLADTGVTAPLYSLEGTAFVTAPNPVLIHGGLPNYSLFVDLGLYRVLVYRYTGPEGQMSVDSPDIYFEQIEEFEFGMDFSPEDTAITSVSDMDALRDAPVTAGTVSVLGYNSVGDAPVRTYVWDATSVDEEDGGYVVGSDHSDTGNWILLWGDEAIPCTAYGVFPGDEGNVGRLMSYPDTVGSFHLKTAPCVRFVNGTYSTDVTHYTAREVWFDPSAVFPSATFSCPSVRTLGKRTTYVADFVLGATATAHSSWFRTASAFLSCGARILHVDATNYFTDATVRYAYTLTGVELHADGHLPFTFVSPGRITLDGVTVVGTRFIGTANPVTFRDMEFREEWMYGSVNNYDFVSTTIVRTAYSDTILLANFRNVTAYLKCVEADGQTDIDLAGRRVGTITTATARILRNVSCDTLNVTATNANVEFHNVTCQGVNISASQLAVYDSVVKFSTEPTLNALFCHNSDVATQYAVTGMAMSATFEKCRVGVSFARGTDNSTRDGALVYKECTFYRNNAIASKNLSMYGCVTDESIIKVYPYHDGTNYRIFVRLVGNQFVGATPVEFTKTNDDNCYDCIADWTIEDNAFTGNDEGLRCRYWSNRTGSQFDKTFIVPDNRSSIVYSGNSGSCPAESMRGCGIPAGATPYRTVDIGSGNKVYAYSGNGTWTRACPVYGEAQTASGTNKLYRVSTPDTGFAVSVDTSASRAMRSVLGVSAWNYADALGDRDGDLFQLALSVWVTQLDSHWAVSVV